MIRYACVLAAGLGLLTLGSCAATVGSNSVTAKASGSPHMQSVNGENMLIGDLTREELFTAFDPFRMNYETYEPQDSVIKLLKQCNRETTVEIFLGTWCGDSKRNLPHFLKVLDRAELSNVHTALHGLDRTKTDRAKGADRYNISRVPTMIFYRNGREIGRIVEHPKASIEEDMLAVLR